MQFQMGEIGRGHFGCTCSASLSSRKRAQGSGGKRSQKINSGATEAAAESNSKADEEKLFTVTVKQNHSLKSFESLKKKQSKQRLGQVQWIPFYLQLRNKLRLLRVQKKNRRVKGEKLSLGSRN
ncbi:unnamed protein product [Brassica rapa]|uniref:Uncharacterized protein n=1 Tax=Brassica campestris TaxID=3711 RepID=A0A8D9GYK1_BRACM|nr:unnamed protein product [Brassica rapa]CAG7893903.1 unnamed protein product [Brassica rapa]CAG7902570.1 unnamed protein product [Brassica rapa]